MKVSECIAHHLAAWGVVHGFEQVGGATTLPIDRLAASRIVTMRHEQAAADADGWLTGIPGVALAASRPGALDLLAGVGRCHFDSSPAVFFTGQVSPDEQKGGRAIRQLGFQEADVVATAAPMTTAAWRVDRPDDVPAILDRSFALAVEGRPGAALVDIPIDVQRPDIDTSVIAPIRRAPESVDPAIIGGVFEHVTAAERPPILAGGGVQASGAITAFCAFVRRARVPVAQSLMGVDILSHEQLYRIDKIGFYGNHWANTAIAWSDLWFVLGSRLDVRQTGALADDVGRGRSIIHVDCETGEISSRVKDCLTVVAHLSDFLEAARSANLPRRYAWLTELSQMRRERPDTGELTGLAGIDPNAVLHDLSRRSDMASAYAVDVGQHQMWSGQSLELPTDQRFLISGGMGARPIHKMEPFAAPLGVEAT